MAKFTAVLLAAMALLTGAQAACPASKQACGYYWIDILKCISREELLIRNPNVDPYTSIYETDPSGYVWRFVEACNSAPNRICVQEGSRPDKPQTHCAVN